MEKPVRVFKTRSDEDPALDYWKATERFISYFKQAVTSLAPPASVQDESQILGNAQIDVLSRDLSAGMQTLMEEITQNIRWFRDKGRSSALQLGKMKAEVERIHVDTDNTNAWHNDLTIQDIQHNLSEVSKRYGKEGMERLSQLQKKIVEFHQEVIAPEQKKIKADLIERDRKVRREETKQVGWGSVDIPIGRPADLVTYSMTIGLAILRPFTKMFCHKKTQKSSDRVQAMQMEAQIDKAKLRVVEAHAERLNASKGAIKECSTAFAYAHNVMYDPVNEYVTLMVASQRMQPTEAFEDDLDELCSEFQNSLDLHQDFDAQVDGVLDSLISCEHGPIKNRATIQIEGFYHMTKNISSDIGSLLTIEELIHQGRQHEFTTDVCKIAEETAEMLCKIKDVFDLWGRHTKLGTGKPVPHSVRKEAAGVVEDLLPFDRDIRERIDNLEKILHKKHAKSSSKGLQKLQRDGDRVHKGATWEGRPLATTSEASEIVQKLNDMVSAISKLSNGVMLPLTLGSGDGANDSNSDKLGEEVSLFVPETTLTMISAALSNESIILQNLARKRTVLTPRKAK